MPVESPPAEAAPVEEAQAEARPLPEPPAPAPAPAPAAVNVAILYSASAPGQAAIAGAIAKSLAGPAWVVLQLDTDALDAAPDGTGIVAPVDALLDAGVSIAAAVGPRALEVARERFRNAEIVYSQVLEPGAESNAAPRVRGVAPMPPPALQLAAWAEVDPGLARIGLITSERFAEVVADATEAARAVGAELVHNLSTSDRETLYIFRRLAPTIDGLWLVPDSKILSMAVIEAILAHAAELDIGVLVFNENLLDRGGLLSVGAPPEHVAGSVVSAIEAIRAGRAASLPTEIPLMEGSVRVNARVAAALGLPETPPAWVIRGP